MPENVLITGGTGLIGQHLANLLRQQGYTVSLLSREKRPQPQAKVYQWDARQRLDPEALAGADHIVHLAGAGVADERWTPARKRLILESRTLSTRLLAQQLAQVPHRVRTFVGASAVGLYGLDTGDRWVDESSPAGSDFLAQVVRDWEAETDQVATLGIRTVKVRIGIVLSPRGGALEKMAQPIRLFTGAPLGSGRQWMSWIHLADLGRLLLAAIQNPAMQGAYNGVGPHPATNEAMTRAIAAQLHRPVLPVNVPQFALELLLGQMAAIVTGGNRVSAQKVLQTGFAFQFPDLAGALGDLLK
jgi:uncharacterized protein (TIGR01777 family)